MFSLVLWMIIVILLMVTLYCFFLQFSKLSEKSVLAGSALVTPNSSFLPVPVINLSPNSVWLEPNTYVGTVEICTDFQSLNTIQKHQRFSSKNDLSHIQCLLNSIQDQSSLTERQKNLA